MNKDLIRKRFSKRLSVYNENAKIQKQMAKKLLEYIPSDVNFDSILEIGCGTGLLTELVINKVKSKNYIALDIVSDCSKYIKNISNDIEFVNNDIEEFIKTSTKFDLIISNASLQWIENLPEFIEKLLQKLNSNGIIIFSTFGPENFREIFYVLGKTLPYYSKDELAQKFKNHLKKIEEETRVINFDSPLEVLKHIKNTGVNALNTEVWTKKNLLNFEKSYNIFCKNQPTLTYNPMYVVIQK